MNEISSIVPEPLQTSVRKMTARIGSILGSGLLSAYLYGSAACGDFRPGWSDIDILVLTSGTISVPAAERLVSLRQEMLSEEPDNIYYRSFEGGMLSLDAFRNNAPDRVVYWGTSGERISERYDFNSFSRLSLIDSGILLSGEDVRGKLPVPSFDELKKDVAAHLDTIRKYAHLSGRSLYSFGWMLDISRCLYTLMTGKIAPKTAAGEWALEQGLCPVPEVLEYALKIRRSPLLFRDDPDVQEFAGSINDAVQKYADVLEAAMHRSSIS
ncbi:MAG: DUF4111 domain-containing protein [Clostridia bacterium]|nr:DUF4111 domain-containing protein [Clostridia bacterium]